MKVLVLTLTRSIRSGSFRMQMENRKTNAGADENRAVTSVADMLMRAREYM
jgi:hypothetical protein